MDTTQAKVKAFSLGEHRSKKGLLGVPRTSDSDATVDERSEEKGLDAKPSFSPSGPPPTSKSLQALAAKSA